MVFQLYFDPAVIAAAEAGGAYALQCLIGILRGFGANCLLAEFEDYFVQGALRELLKDLQDDNARKTLKSLFATLYKRNRFVYVLVSGGTPPEVRVDDAFLQGAQVELDLILTENPDLHPNPHGIPACSLQTYNITSFETERAAVSNGGRTFASGSHSDRDFLDWTLRKALKHCTSIQVYDKLFGERFRGNFEVSAKAFIHWLETFVADPSKVSLEIHCGMPSGNTPHFIQNQLTIFRRGRLAAMPITVQFYNAANGEILPHQRYLITHQIALDLGRGMDFLDPTTQRNRDGKFGFVTPEELASALRALPAPSVPRIAF